MVLLGWHVLRPHNSLAAIRYPSPVCLSSIRVFPTGAQPFSQAPETVAYGLIYILVTNQCAHPTKFDRTLRFLRPCSLQRVSDTLNQP